MSSGAYIDFTEPQSPSLVSKLLKLQDCLELNYKTIWMGQQLICLEIRGCEPKPELHKVFLNTEQERDFIAVSYPWHPTPGLESDISGLYTIYDPRYGNSRESKVRDIVLNRIVNYAEKLRLRHFWIDGECIGQTESEVKQQALSSIDLVYNRSAYPLGLLSVVLETQDQVDTLGALLVGSLLTQDKRSYPKFLSQPRASDIDRVLLLLKHVSSDRWWSRAWIFQEEYLSSTRMQLLIRHRSDLLIPESLGCVDGEVCMSASSFREGATRYLLAVIRASNEARRRRCERLLKVCGKYNIQYQFQKSFQHRAMSSRILDEIDRRQIAEPYDLLSIAANSCGYALKLNREKMAKLGYSTEVCALAMCLLNGELIRNCDLIRKTPEGTKLGRYVRNGLFDRFHPPTSDRILSYIKTCRLSNVDLSVKGIHTGGHLWEIVRRIETRLWRKPLKQCTKRNPYGLGSCQRDHLASLAKRLARSGRFRVLADHFRAYLYEDLTTGRTASPAMQHKYDMATKVVQALERKRPLFLAKIQGSQEVLGIFVGQIHIRSRAFTSWSDDPDADDRTRPSRMSIEVEASPTDSTLLKALDWVNGLVFFRQKDSKEVVFRWPKAWM